MKNVIKGELAYVGDFIAVALGAALLYGLLLIT